ncbi:MAG: hypothetical protein EXS08_08795 [Planctomycetes bacterium]|nr:hypothetical protein [Planctomycetota bacterium]
MSQAVRRGALSAAGAFGLIACGASPGGVQTGWAPGSEVARPGGGTFFVDPSQGGHATGLHLIEMNWGRLVDVYALDAAGAVEREPAFRDLVIAESVQSEPERYRLETNPNTQQTRLVVLRARGASDTGRGNFESLLRFATSNLAPVRPRGDKGPDPLLSFVARNATLVLRFDDALDDGPQAVRALPETVRVLSGEPPELPFAARELFDPNHGTLLGGEFHSTRVLVDLTVSAAESAELPVPQPINAAGLPPSSAANSVASAALRLPTRTAFGSGQFALLRGNSGAALAETGNGPVAADSPTHELVRGLRSGNSEDSNHGFLLDLNAPTIVGAWAALIEAARPDPAGRDGFDFLVDVRFTSVCRAAPAAGDVLDSGTELLEVLEGRPAADEGGRVSALRAHSLARAPLGSASSLIGNASYLSTYRAADPVPAACWLRFSPPPAELPASGVSTTAEVRVRFSEPMDPASLSPFDELVLVRGDSNAALTPRSRIVGDIAGSLDGREFALRPTLPLPHTALSTEVYHVRLGHPTDLAGNPLASSLPSVSFTLAAEQAEQRSFGTTLRFTGVDELEPLGAPDFRGEFLLDLAGECLRPRPVAFSSYPADRSNPVPALMTVGPLAIQTPFSPLGSKLQTLWRYCDLGWQVLDESKYDLDVVGLSWAPFGGRVVNDFFEGFEIRLAHSRFQPDESVSMQAVPAHERSGLNNQERDFLSNVLADPQSPQKVVYPRELGYHIRGTDLFTTSTGTVLLPFPLNRGTGVPLTYTWRDTAVLSRGAPNGVGIPLDIEAGAPLELEEHAGYVARAGQVPSYGLPLLMEFRCFPSSSAIGINGCDVSFAVNSSALPAFRSYSSGGTNTSGLAVQRDPELESVAHGGFNPRSNPPGKPTARSDNTFYVGQLDVVTRLSRVHTVWIDTQLAAPDFSAPVVSPRANEQPPGTRVVLEYRAAHGFELADLDGALGHAVDEASFPFDARHLNAYGDIFAILPETTPLGQRVDKHEWLGSVHFPGAVLFQDGIDTWSADIEGLDGARYVQLRITFLGNIESLRSAELSALGLAYSTR